MVLVSVLYDLDLETLPSLAFSLFLENIKISVSVLIKTEKRLVFEIHSLGHNLVLETNVDIISVSIERL